MTFICKGSRSNKADRFKKNIINNANQLQQSFFQRTSSHNRTITHSLDTFDNTVSTAAVLRGPLLNQAIIKCVVGTALQIDKSLTFVRGAQAACCFLRLIFDRWIKSFPTYSPVLRSPPPRHQTVSESRRQ